MTDRVDDKLAPNPVLTATTIVLVRARNPANVGAVARAMHDFGFSSLRVVNEFPVPFEAARSAVDASAVLASATSHSSLAEAIADCTLVLGTTAVGERELRHELLHLPQAAARIRSHLADPGPSPRTAQVSSQSSGAPPTSAAQGRVALLFGSEKTGLSNDELSFCHALVTIPMFQHAGQRHPSMNLGQAVAVCLWELVRDPSSQPSVASELPAASADLDRLHALLTEVLESTGYTHRYAANSDPADIRRLIRRMRLTAADAPVWMGMLRQVLWKLGGDRQ